MVRLLLFVPLLLGAASLKPELFLPQLAKSPYYSAIKTKELMASKRLKEAKAPFDTRIFGKYEKKEYPLSSSLYEELGIKKRLFSGVEAFGKYRYAKGVQEYNNIKTGPDGELQVGATIAINRLFGFDKATLTLQRSKIDAKIAMFEAMSSYQKLLLQVMERYVDLLASHEILRLDRKMLQTLKSRQKLIDRLIAEGVLPKVARLQIEGAILEQEGALQSSLARFKAAFSTFDSYFLGTFRHYELPELSSLRIPKPSGDFQKRAEFMINDLLVRQIEADERYIKTQRFGDITASIYGVKDRYYERSGAKGVVGVVIPIERSGYEGARERLVAKRQLLRAKRSKLTMRIEGRIEALSAKKEGVERRIAALEKRADLAKRIEQVALKKLKSGIGDLFELNRQSFARLKVQKSLLEAIAERKRIELGLLYEHGEMERFVEIHTATMDRSALADEE